MVADFKSNKQAGYNASAQGSEDDRQLPGQPVDIKEIFPGRADIQALAKKVTGQIKILFRRTLQNIIEIGNYLKEIELEVKSVFGSEDGEDRFKQWLKSPSGVGSAEIALSMMDITSELAPLPAEGGDRPVTHSDWSNLRKKNDLTGGVIADHR